MAAPGITIVMSFWYRGHDEEWSQQYHIPGEFGSDFAFSQQSLDLANAIAACVTNQTVVLRTYGYDNTDDPHVYSHVFDTPIPGTLTRDTDEIHTPGDDAVWVRWDTGRMSHGKHIYLRKYFHDALAQDATHPDTIAASQATALNTFGALVLAGTTHGFVIADKNGDEPTGGVGVSEFITTRTLKRRGARPTPP